MGIYKIFMLEKKKKITIQGKSKIPKQQKKCEVKCIHKKSKWYYKS